jgi:hypothetical protein
MRMSDKPKSKDLLTSGSGLDFFGAQAYISQTPTHASNSNGAGKSLDGDSHNEAAKARKKKPPPKSPRSNSGLGLGTASGNNNGSSSSSSTTGQRAAENLGDYSVGGNDVTSSSALTAAAGERWVHRHVGQRVVGDGIGLSQVCDGLIVT